MPWATPFSRHCVQRAWWDAYGATAHDQTLIVADEADPETIVGIVPLMHRHELEPGDVAARTTIRHQPGSVLRPVPAAATAVFFGASYHADYATVLAAPDDLGAACEAVVEALAAQDPERWDVVDLRRLRSGDPAVDALVAAFEWAAPKARWLVTREREDVCPVVTLAPGVDFDGYLATLDKKERHEIRRKIRRAEAAGDVRLEPSANPIDDLDAFVELHQKRWGVEGLFPPTKGGAASRRFFAGLFEDCAPSGIVDLSFLTVGGRRVAAGVTFDDGQSVYYYNAGVEPDARELSPGVVMVALYIQRAIELGRTRLDFLRGDEPYKYEWGGVDAPIERLLVQRTAPAAEGR
jgi:CelD/BcsL family acetyltransferase involved in cellulose biosynthesis